MTIPLAGGGVILTSTGCLPLTVPTDEWQKCIERAKEGYDTIIEAGTLDWVITPELVEDVEHAREKLLIEQRT